jgi:proteasome lid subunit RPN8/RPN11
MKFVIGAQEVARFKALCKSAYPVERFGALIGSMSDDRWSVSVARIWTPPESEARRYCSKSKICLPDQWWTEAQEEAEEEGFMVVGDVHSHCYEGPSDGVRSETDLIHSKWWAVEGVVTIWPTRRGVLRSHVRFWGPCLKVETYYAT